MFTLESNDGAAVFVSGEHRLRIAFITESIARITWTEGREFCTTESRIVTTQKRFTN